MTSVTVGPITGPARNVPVPVVVALLTLIVLGLASAGAWRGTGGRWAVIETPSMGRAIPVGSLILTRPSLIETVQVGDVVTYRPKAGNSLYTHRVVSVVSTGPAGAVVVQGDLNGTPDPYPVTQDMLVGKVVAHWFGLGWLMRALPTLLLSLIVLTAISKLYVPGRWRSSVRILGTCLTFGATSLLLRPFVHPVLVNAVSHDGTDVRATVVSTGILPIRVTGAPGQYIDLVAGQAGSVPVLQSGPGGPVMVNAAAHLTGWWLIGVGIACALPLVWVLVFGLAPGTPRAEEPSENGATGA